MILYIVCFFHFSKMIRGKLQQIGQCKKKLNRYNVEIISNIELLCFINMEKIKEFQKIILEHLKSDKNMTKFIRFLTNYLFKLNPQIYNYSELINYFKSKDNMLYLENLYTSNNICESINSKLNYYLPKRTTNNYDFIKSIGKVLLNNKILNNEINRKDYKTKSLIKLIEDKDFNENLEWINFNDFKKYIKLVINDEDDNILTEQVKLDLLNKILDIEEEEIKIEDPINSINTILNNSIQNNFINDLMEETN